MKPLTFCLIILTALAFNFSNAMKNSRGHTTGSVQNSIYRVWKFKKIEMIINSTDGMDAVCSYDTWDLTKRGILRYSVPSSPNVFDTVPYKLINDALVLQFPGKKNNADVHFKIKEITSTSLKVVVHAVFNQEGKTQNLDLFELDFGPKE